MRISIGRRLLGTPFECARWQDRPTTAGVDDRPGRHRVTTYRLLAAYAATDLATGASGHDRGFETARDALATYRLFTPSRMRPHVCSPDGRAAAGVTIIQRTVVGPAVIESAVRVAAFDERAVAGRREATLVYVTVDGHPERGVARYSVILEPDGSLRMEAETHSAIAHPLVFLGAPVARWVQDRATDEAGRSLRDAAAREVLAPTS